MKPCVCLLCGHNNNAVLLYPSTIRTEDFRPEIFSARRIPDRLHGDILRCSRCGLVYPRLLPDEALLAHLYGQSSYAYATLESSIVHTYKRYALRAIRHLSKMPPPFSSVDIGCGNGFMVRYFRTLGFDAWGIEPSKDALQKADPAIRDRIIRGFASQDLMPANHYDVLTCFQTLDHLPDPLGTLRACLRTLKPGGVVLFINHNIASWPAWLLGRHSPMIDIEHTYLHTPSTMRTLFERVGFSDIEVFSVCNSYPLWYWCALAPMPGRVRKFLQRLLRWTGMENMSLPLKVGNLGLIARKQ